MITDLHSLSGAYCLDALADDERRAFEAHYPTCETCREEVGEFRATATQLAEATATRPPSALRDRILAEVAQTRQLPPRVDAEIIDLAARRRTRSTVMAGAAAAMIIALVAIGVLRSGSRDPTVEDITAAGDAVATVLQGDDGIITAVWSPSERRVALIGGQVPHPGPDRTYELWFVVDDGVVPAGLFEPDDGVLAVVVELDDDDPLPLGWGVTNEPAGGSDQPTGDILYVGT